MNPCRAETRWTQIMTPFTTMLNSGYILEMFLQRSTNHLVTFLQCSTNHLVMFLQCSTNHLAMFLQYSTNHLATFLQCSTNHLATFLQCSCSVLPVFHQFSCNVSLMFTHSSSCQWVWGVSAGFLQTCFWSLVSSVRRTLFQKSAGLFRCSFVNLSHVSIFTFWTEEVFFLL